MSAAQSNPLEPILAKTRISAGAIAWPAGRSALTGLLLGFLALGSACDLAAGTTAQSLHASQTRRYALTIEHAESDSAPGTLALHLRPVAPYKLATEFPIKIRYRAPANAPMSEQIQLRADDAKSYEDEGAHFEWSAPDARDLAIRFAFGVCRDEFCEPVEVDLEVVLPAETGR